MEMDEAQQMNYVVNWFKDSLDLPRGFHVKDVHTQTNYQRRLRGANITLTGGADISIGPSNTECVWIETKKTEKDFKEGQAVGELFLVDSNHALKSMVVLTDCNNHWNIFYFMEKDGGQFIAKSKIDDRGIALAVIKQFLLEEGITFSDYIGNEVKYTVKDEDRLTPLQKKAKFIECADYEDRMADIVVDMSEQELFNMKARKKLKLVREFCRLDEQPQMDQLIRQFSDNYENQPLMMFA